MKATVEKGNLLVVCEGITEVCYLQELAAFMKIESRVEIRHSPLQSPFDALGTIAQNRLWAKACGNPLTSEIWLVFDRDSHNGYLKTAQLAEKLGIHPAFSRPCIEYWFLCHFPNAQASLPLDTRLCCESQKTVRKEASGWITECTRATYLRVSSPKVCMAELKRKAPWYNKTKLCFLEHFASGTRIAYQQTKAKATQWKDNGSAIPLLIDRFCEVAGMTPKALFESLEKANSSSFKRVQLSSGFLQINLPQVKQALDILASATTVPTEDEWIYCTHALSDAATAVKNSIMNGPSTMEKQKLLETLQNMEKSSEKVSVTISARSLQSQLAQYGDRLETLPANELKQLFKMLHQLLHPVQNVIADLKKSRAHCTPRAVVGGIE